MSRTVAVIVHALISFAACAMYFFFVLPRWWELEGDISPTWGMVFRIITGVLIGLAALPVVFTWLRTRRPEYGTPELALRLRVCSIVLHVVCGLVIVFTAISEIWFKVDNAGQWLFGIYGAAAAIGLLAIFSFYLSFVAELPPPPPRPLKKSERKSRWRRRKDDADDADDAAHEATESEGETEDEEEDVIPEKTWGEQVPGDAAEELQKPLPVSKADDETVEAEASDESPSGDEAPEAGDAAPTSDVETTASGDAAEDSAADKDSAAEEDTAAGDDVAAAKDTVNGRASGGGLRNRRPAGKIRRSRRVRKSESGVTVDDE
jgi:hypothetical protein